MTVTIHVRVTSISFDEISVHAPMTRSCMQLCDGADTTIYQYRPTLEWQSLVEYSREVHWQSLVEYSHEV